MPQDPKKIAQKKLNDLRKMKSTPEKDSALKAARERLTTNYNVLPKIKSAPVSDTNNSAGEFQRAREMRMSKPALEHIQSAEQDRMKIRDTPLSATPETQRNRMLDLSESNK